MTAESVCKPGIVQVTREIDMTNSLEVYNDLCAAAAVQPAGGMVVADLTGTRFCDSSGVREICHAREYALITRIDMRLVIPPGPVMRVFQLLGLDQELPVYETLSAALHQGTMPDC
ncbi:MAG TPA: STAS domain-containing protein [Streptosporangiaceae bacterium]|nr:STAS domain-containing protein [Streptosporangiaceae bacterium]